MNLPESIRKELPENVVRAFDFLGSDIDDMTAAVDVDTQRFVGLGHIVGEKFEQYNFEDPSKTTALLIIQEQYYKEYEIIYAQTIHYSNLGIMGRRLLFGSDFIDKIGYCNDA